MSTSPVRPAMVPISRRIRGYFAPINRIAGTPTLFDPGQSGLFPLNQPPFPWIDLGWIDNFIRLSGTPVEALCRGGSGGAVTQVRGAVSAHVEFDFREWGKLQMALAGGSEHMNVLATDPSASPQPSGGTALPAVSILPGSTANELVVGSGIVGSFSAGDMVAVDLDYQQQTGYVGSGIAAAYISDPADVNRDPNYLRRITFNVGRVAQTTATSLLLAQPLLGGAPTAGASLQKVVAFVDRDGGSFFQEWSALFVAEEESGGRVCFHYPRLSPVGSISKTSLGQTSKTGGFQREQIVEIANPITSWALHAAFQAMAHVDENDGQTAVCYRSYFPARMAGIY